jgi:hypothetical protein
LVRCVIWCDIIIIINKNWVWHLGLSSGYVFRIELRWSSKFTAGGCGKQEPWSMPPSTPVIFGVYLKMLWDFSYHDQEEGGTLSQCTLHILHNIIISSWWFCLNIASKCMTPH